MFTSIALVAIKRSHNLAASQRCGCLNTTHVVSAGACVSALRVTICTRHAALFISSLHLIKQAMKQQHMQVSNSIIQASWRLQQNALDELPARTPRQAELQTYRAHGIVKTGLADAQCQLHTFRARYTAPGGSRHHAERVAGTLDAQSMKSNKVLKSASSIDCTLAGEGGDDSEESVQATEDCDTRVR
jgi:hypothetical protein